MNAALPAAGGTWSSAIQSSTATGIVSVPTGTSQTFHIYAYLLGGTGTVTGYGTLTAVTLPFGSTGFNTLGVASGDLASRGGRGSPPPPG
jgi:hypothetical protein